IARAEARRRDAREVSGERAVEEVHAEREEPRPPRRLERALRNEALRDPHVALALRFGDLLEREREVLVRHERSDEHVIADARELALHDPRLALGGDALRMNVRERDGLRIDG